MNGGWTEFTPTRPRLLPWWRRTVPNWVVWVFVFLALSFLLMDSVATVGGGVLSNPDLESNPVVRGIVREAGARGYVWWVLQEALLTVLLATVRPVLGAGWSLVLIWEHAWGVLSWL